MVELPENLEKAAIKAIPCPLMNRLSELGSEDALCHPDLKRKAVACLAKKLRDTGEEPDMSKSMKAAWDRIKSVCADATS